MRRIAGILTGSVLIWLAMTFSVAAAASAEETEMTGGNGVPSVSAQKAVVMELKTGRVLYEKNGSERAYPASTTKILTALLAIEEGEEDQRIQVSEEAAKTEGSSIYLKPGEKVLLQDLIYGLMLRSGNDAAVAIAEGIDGDSASFVDRMNRRAEELGAVNTHFVNPNGLFDPDHYTTALDMARIARAAMLCPAFREVAGAKTWDASRESGLYRCFTNKNKVLYQYEGGTGVKIGYTRATGRTLVASSERNGMEVICVVMQASNWFEDSYRLMDWAYENYEMREIASAEETVYTLPLQKGKRRDSVRIGGRNVIFCPVRKDGSESVALRFDLPGDSAGGVSRWQKAGWVGIEVDKREICRQKLYYLEDK